MEELRYTLISEGSSDVALLPILNWLLIENGVRCAIQPAWADLSVLPLPKRPKLADKMRVSLDYYPCNLLSVHRVSDQSPRERRVQEINRAANSLAEGLTPPLVCVIPVRMQESWLLIDEAAIKAAAGNKSYRGQLDLPSANRLEKIQDPKEILTDLLRQASDLIRRRQKRFPVTKYARLETEFIEDFSPLRRLNSFAALEEDIGRVIQANNWNV